MVKNKSIMAIRSACESILDTLEDLEDAVDQDDREFSLELLREIKQQNKAVRMSVIDVVDQLLDAKIESDQE